MDSDPCFFDESELDRISKNFQILTDTELISRRRKGDDLPIFIEVLVILPFFQKGGQNAITDYFLVFFGFFCKKKIFDEVKISKKVVVYCQI